MQDLKKLEENIDEVLERSCPRCGKASANKSNPSGRCSSCLKKLKTAKKTPGHWQRAQTKADDALRRQKGKNGTAHKKHSGLGNRDSIVKQTQSAEKKTGQKLSPDRKNNSKGYAAANTRMVPEKLNRGRHHVDEKKLRNWKKRLKKSEIDTASLYTLMKAKYKDNSDALDLLKSIGPDGLDQYIKLFDTETNSEVLKKDANIDKSKFKYKHAKSDATHSHYDVHHDGNLVGQISIDKKTSTPSSGYVQPAFNSLLSHIGDSVKAFHIARNTITDN